MTTMQQQARTAYTTATLGTASPQKLMLMLWDRLVLDVERGLRAQMAEDHGEASRQLVHAQAIMTEFQATLDTEGWTGGRELLALYGYLQRRLVQANISKDQVATKEVLAHCRALRTTWHRAAEIAARGE